MAIPGEWEPLWKRRVSRGRTRVGDDLTESERPRRNPLTYGGLWFAMVLLVIIFFYTMIRSLMGIFAGGAATAPLHLSVCTSTTVGTRLGTDLLGAFLEREGAQSVHAVVNGPITRLTSRLPGRLLDTTLEMRSEDSAFAFDALASGRCNVAIIGRGINPFEAARFTKPPVSNLIALDGAVLVVNPANPLHSISDTAVRSIFDGTTRNWSQIGGVHGTIRTVLPLEHADEFSVFVEHVLHGRLPAEQFHRSSNVAQTVAAPGNRNALGLTTFHASDPAKLLQTRSRGGHDIPASTLTIGRRTYPLVIPIYAYRTESEMTPSAYQFIAFLMSEEGQNLVIDDGFVSPFAF